MNGTLGEDVVVGPLARLKISRERLRLAMSPPPPPDPESPSTRSWVDGLKAKIMSVPVVGAVVDSVQEWWGSHPARPVAQVASQAATAAVQPVARHHPLLLMLAAFGIGAGVFWAKPWKLILRSALFAGVLPQMATRAITRMPIDSWLAVLNTTLASPRRRPVHPSAAPEAAAETSAVGA